MDPESEPYVNPPLDWAVGHASNAQQLSQYLAAVYHQGWIVHTICFGEMVGALNPKPVFTIVLYRQAQPPLPQEPVVPA